MKKYIVGFILGVLFCFIGVASAYSLFAINISFTPKDTSWNVENTKEALDDLHHTCNYCKTSVLGLSWNFDFVSREQKFTVPSSGMYKIELWGAQGGNSTNGVTSGGKGAYTSGKIVLEKNQDLYFYVGGTATGSTNESGGYNGGGNSIGVDSQVAGGGGATDVRLIKESSWSDFASLKSRIMVAAGGGGAARANSGNNSYSGHGGAAGGIEGYTPITLNGSSSWQIGNGGKQNTSTGTGGFGYGGRGVGEQSSGGGSGYYGASGSSYCVPSGGGSSFISGHQGCDAISDSSTSNNIIHTSQPNHYSGLVFTSTKIIDGEGYNWTNEKETQVGMPTIEGTATENGHSGNGYAKITLISLKK